MNNSPSTANTKFIVVSSLLWKCLERTSSQGIQFVVQIILARLLMPEDFGLIALIMVFVNLAQVFVQSGFNTALIQNNDVKDIDFSSVFYLSFVLAGILYIILYFTAPVIASFYKMPILTKVLRIISIILFLGAINSIQNAYIAREYMFKKLFYCNLIAVICSGTIGIFMAYKGYGIWALVWQQIMSSTFISIILWFTIKWRPMLVFSLSSVKVLFSFAWKLLVSQLLITFYMNIQSLVIGKIFTPATLGYYNRGEMFPRIIIANIDGSIQSVMLTTYSRKQNDRQRVKQLVRRSITMSSFLVFPLMAGLIATAELVVKIILSDKWLPCVPFLRISCLSLALMPIHTTNLQAINALGRSDIVLQLEIIKKTYTLIILGIAVFYFKNVFAIAWCAVFEGIIGSFVNSYPNKKLLNYGYFEQLKDLMPQFLIASTIGLVVYPIKYVISNIYLTLFTQSFVGLFIYLLLSWIFKIDSLKYILNLLSQGGKIGK